MQKCRAMPCRHVCCPTVFKPLCAGACPPGAVRCVGSACRAGEARRCERSVRVSRHGLSLGWRGGDLGAAPTHLHPQRPRGQRRPPPHSPRQVGTGPPPAGAHRDPAGGAGWQVIPRGAVRPRPRGDRAEGVRTALLTRWTGVALTDPRLGCSPRSHRTSATNSVTGGQRMLDSRQCMGG